MKNLENLSKTKFWGNDLIGLIEGISRKDMVEVMSWLLLTNIIQVYSGNQQHVRAERQKQHRICQSRELKQVQGCNQVVC